MAGCITRTRGIERCLPRTVMLLRDARRRAWVIQAALLAAIVGVGALLVSTTVGNLSQRGIPLGWNFLWAPSQVVISESLLSHDHEAAT